MPWFKVDDSLHSSQKATMAGEAMALWILAGSWCADQLTDGVVPLDVVKRLCPSRKWRVWSDRLVAAGLWEPVYDGVAESRECRVRRTFGAHSAYIRAFRFHDWDHYQPTKSDVLAERQAGRERQKRSRERRRSQRDTGELSRVTLDLVTPTRPDPLRTTPVMERSDVDSRLGDQTAKRATRGGPARQSLIACGASPSEADALIRRVQASADPQNMDAFVNAMISRGTIGQWLTEMRAAVVKTERKAAIDKLRNGPECGHGVAGGEALHPDSRLPLCVQCRQKARFKLREAL